MRRIFCVNHLLSECIQFDLPYDAKCTSILTCYFLIVPNQGDEIMRFIHWIFSILIFLFICTFFIQFGNSVLNIILLISIIIFGIRFLIQKYSKY